MTARPRHVLLVHRYFDPDVTSYARMLSVLASELVDRGDQVTVLCGPVTYRDSSPIDSVARTHGARVIRLRFPWWRGTFGRILDMTLMPLAVLVTCARLRPDLVSVTTMPPVVMGLAAAASRRRGRTKVVYHCMDLYPEAAVAQGLLRNRWLARLAAAADSVTMRRADHVLVLSDDMADTIRQRGVTRTANVVANFNVERYRSDRSAVIGQNPSRADSGGVRFVFAGNIGRFQDIESLLEGIAICAAERDDFSVVFMGGGNRADLVTARIGQLPVELIDHRPLEEAMSVMADCDVGIVSLSRGVIGSAYPSKLMTYLEVGLDVLAILEPKSQLARFVVSNGVGDVASPADPKAIAAAMTRLITGTRTEPQKVREIGRASFDRDIGVARWVEAYGLAT